MTRSIEVIREDEIGRFVAGFNAFIAKLADIAIKVKDSQRVLEANTAISGIASSRESEESFNKVVGEIAETDALVREMEKAIVEKREGSHQILEALSDTNGAAVEVKDGKAHGLFFVGWNAERDAYLSWSLPVVDGEYGFFVRVDDPLQYKEGLMKGYTVAVYGPSNMSTTLDMAKGKEPGMIIEVSPAAAVLRKLDANRVTAAFSNRDVGLAIIKRLQLKNVRYAGTQSKLKYYIGFAKAFVPKETVDKFNDTYRKLYKSGEIPRILKSYGMEPSALE